MEQFVGLVIVSSSVTGLDITNPVILHLVLVVSIHAPEERLSNGPLNLTILSHVITVESWVGKLIATTALTTAYS